MKEATVTSSCAIAESRSIRRYFRLSLMCFEEVSLTFRVLVEYFKMDSGCLFHLRDFVKRKLSLTICTSRLSRMWKVQAKPGVSADQVRRTWQCKQNNNQTTTTTIGINTKSDNNNLPMTRTAIIQHILGSSSISAIYQQDTSSLAILAAA